MINRSIYTYVIHFKSIYACLLLINASLISPMNMLVVLSDVVINTFSFCKQPGSLISIRCSIAYSLHLVRIVCVRPVNEDIFACNGSSSHLKSKCVIDHIPPLYPVRHLILTAQTIGLTQVNCLHRVTTHRFPYISLCVFLKANAKFVCSVVGDGREFRKDDVGFCACSNFEDYFLSFLDIHPEVLEFVVARGFHLEGITLVIRKATYMFVYINRAL